MASYDMMMDHDYVSGLDGDGMYQLVLSATRSQAKAQQARALRDAAVAMRQVPR